MLDQPRTQLRESWAVVECRENERPLGVIEVDQLRSESVGCHELVCQLRVLDRPCELGDERVVHGGAVDDHVTAWDPPIEGLANGATQLPETIDSARIADLITAFVPVSRYGHQDRYQVLAAATC